MAVSETADDNTAFITAQENTGKEFELEIQVPDGNGGTRQLTAKGHTRHIEPIRCLFHFIAYGICVDCSRAAGRQVWAS